MPIDTHTNYSDAHERSAAEAVYLARDKVATAQRVQRLACAQSTDVVNHLSCAVSLLADALETSLSHLEFIARRDASRPDPDLRRLPFQRH